MFFDSWSDVGRVVVLGTSAYLVLVIALRTSGKRTLAKLNAFDLVVTVALGSTLATILLSQDVSLVDGVTAFAVLIVAQFAVAWLLVGAGVGAFVWAGADHLGGLDVDQRLQHHLHAATDHVDVATGAHCVQQLGQVKLFMGHRCGLLREPG